MENFYKQLPKSFNVANESWKTAVSNLLPCSVHVKEEAVNHIIKYDFQSKIKLNARHRSNTLIEKKKKKESH